MLNEAMGTVDGVRTQVCQASTDHESGALTILLHTAVNGNSSTKRSGTHA